MILLIDNYDSFVYNLARYFAELGCETKVVRNDRLRLEDVREWNPAGIVLSPGPRTPADAGICVQLVRELSSTVPMLGVCLGHQAIATAFGAEVIRAPVPVHGRISWIHHCGSGLFEGLPNPLRGARYHSLIVDQSSLPDALNVTGRTADGIPMALEHCCRPVYGLQFHPESVLSQGGHRLLANFLKRTGNGPSTDFAAEVVPSVSPNLSWYAAEAMAGQPLPRDIRL